MHFLPLEQDKPGSTRPSQSRLRKQESSARFNSNVSGKCMLQSDFTVFPARIPPAPARRLSTFFFIWWGSIDFAPPLIGSYRAFRLSQTPGSSYMTPAYRFISVNANPLMEFWEGGEPERYANFSKKSSTFESEIPRFYARAPHWASRPQRGNARSSAMNRRDSTDSKTLDTSGGSMWQHTHLLYSTLWECKRLVEAVQYLPCLLLYKCRQHHESVRDMSRPSLSDLPCQSSLRHSGSQEHPGSTWGMQAWPRPGLSVSCRLRLEDGCRYVSLPSWLRNCTLKGRRWQRACICYWPSTPVCLT